MIKYNSFERKLLEELNYFGVPEKGKRVIDLPDWEEQIKKDKEVSLITDEDRKEFGID